MDKLLTVVIPSYNVEKYLDKAVMSFINESIINNIEILIVNDGSKDNTAMIAEKYAAQYPESIKHIYKDNGGHGSTINKGLSIAHGKYFKVVDGDDWVDTTEFVKYVKALEQIDTDIIFTPYNQVDIDGNVNMTVSIDEDLYGKTYKIDECITGLGDTYQMHSITFKTQLIKDRLNITENCFYVDQEFILLPLKWAKSIYFLNNVIYQYRLGDVNQSVSIVSRQKNRDMHKRVLERLLKEYSNLYSISDDLRSFIIKRLAGLALIQTDIYLTMPDYNDAKREFLVFWKFIKHNHTVIYSNISGNTAKIMRIAPGAGFKLAYGRMHKKLGL